jgi:hypothetical protein
MRPSLLVPLVTCLLAIGCASGRAVGTATEPPHDEAYAQAPAQAPAPAAPAASAAAVTPSGGAEPSDLFHAKVRPLLEARCSPCHFEGGKMYAKLPFDRPETIHALGQKMFTRIQDDEGRALITSLLEGREAAPK